MHTVLHSVGEKDFVIQERSIIVVANTECTIFEEATCHPCCICTHDCIFHDPKVYSSIVFISLASSHISTTISLTTEYILVKVLKSWRCL